MKQYFKIIFFIFKIINSLQIIVKKTQVVIFFIKTGKYVRNYL